jgi:hypothetical protein
VVLALGLVQAQELVQALGLGLARAAEEQSL